MEKHTRPTTWKVALALVAGAALVVLLWRFIAPAFLLAAGAAALAFLLLPLCRFWERFMGPGAAAALSLLSTLVFLAALLLLVLPALIAQIADLLRSLPAAVESVRGFVERLSAWTQAAGMGEIALPQLDLSGAAGGMLQFAAGTVTFAGGVANAVSQITMAAVLSAFFLVDRHRRYSAPFFSSTATGCFCAWNCWCPLASAAWRCAWAWRHSAKCASICARR